VTVRRATAVAGVTLVALLALLALPAGAAATIEGGCAATATSTSGGTVDLTTSTVWHLRMSDRISVTGGAPFEQTEGKASAYLLGIPIPLASGRSDGERAVQWGTYEAAALAFFGRVFVITGSTSGPFHTCAGQVQVVIDDANPFLTAAGGAGVAFTLVGLFLALWGLRRPAGVGSRLDGLVGLGFLGAGISLVLLQTSTPGGEIFATPAFAASVPGPLQVTLEPAVLVQGAALTLLVILVMPFPSDLFNSTLEANYAEVRGWFTRLPIARVLLPKSTAAPVPGAAAARRIGWSHPLAVTAFVLASGLLYALLDPALGLHARSLVTYLGIVASLVAVTLVAALPRRSMQIALTGDRGRLRAIPGTLAIAAACVLISRVAGFLPGYLYGLILGYEFVRSLEGRDDARATAAGAWWMLGLALVSWFALGAVRTPGIEPSLPAAIAESVFASFVVGGIGGIVFGLVPLRFLGGETLFRWRRVTWAGLYALGVFAFLWIILDPVNGFVGAPEPGGFLTAVALFVGFGLASALFWAYFRFRRRPPSATPPAAAPPAV